MANRELFSVLIGNIKGGCGKTTLAIHLAAAFAAAGYATILADCDRQRSSLKWLARRPEDAPEIVGIDWSKALTPLPENAERLVIDAPAAMRHRDAKELVGLADLVIVPVLPSLLDEDATAYFLRKLGEIKSVRKHRRALALVANRIRTGTKAAEELERYFAGREPGLSARLRDSQIYPALTRAGITVLESANARARGYAEEWRPILELVGLGEKRRKAG